MPIVDRARGAEARTAQTYIPQPTLGLPAKTEAFFEAVVDTVDVAVRDVRTLQLDHLVVGVPFDRFSRAGGRPPDLREAESSSSRGAESRRQPKPLTRGRSSITTAGVPGYRRYPNSA
jgi:hypothetical protein